MKKWFSILLCLFLVGALTVSAVAADMSGSDYYADYEAQYGKAPVVEDFPDYKDYQAAYDRWFSGIGPYIERRKAEEKAAQILSEAEAAKKAAEEEAARIAAEKKASVTLPKSVESAGSKNENDAFPSDYYTGSDYPVGSIVDDAGVVWSPDGQRLSPFREPGTTPAMEPLNTLVSSSRQNDALLSGELADQDGVSTDQGSNALSLDQPVFTVKDLRPIDAPAEVLTGLKSLVTSIFGEYTPVTTTSVISETVGSETNQYLVETVAPGAAGVDYEWIAGVLLFAIMLYCLMKLLGGVLK